VGDPLPGNSRRRDFRIRDGHAEIFCT
jgi:hypothetical protein